MSFILSIFGQKKPIKYETCTTKSDDPPPYQTDQQIQFQLDEKKQISTENVPGLEDYQLAMKFKADGNLDLMKYHLLRSIKNNYGESAYELAKEFRVEKNNVLEKEYLEKGHDLKNFKCTNELISYYLCVDSYNTYSTKCVIASKYINVLIDNNQPIFDHLKKLFFCFNRIQPYNLSYRSTSADCDHFLEPYFIITELLKKVTMNVTMYTQYHSIILTRLMEFYKTIKNKTHYCPWKINEKLLVKMNCENKLVENNRLFLLEFMEREIRKLISWMLNNGDIQIISTIQVFCKEELKDEDFYMECYRVKGELSTKK